MKVLLASIIACNALYAPVGAPPRLYPSLYPTNVPYVILDDNKGILDKCDTALSSCLGVVQAQDEQIALLKSSVKDLSSQLEQASRLPLVPTWMWALAGIMAGSILTISLHK